MKAYAAFAAGMIGLLWGCASGRDGAAPAGEKCYDSLGPIVATYLPAREADSVARWGLVRPDGTMIFSDRFATAPTAAVNGFFTSGSEGDLTVYGVGVDPQPVPGLSGLRHAGVMAYGLMPVCRRGRRIELVDGNGETRIGLSAIDGREIIKTSPYFIDGLLGVYTQDGYWGAINTMGEMVIEPIYDTEPRFSERISPMTRTIEEQADSGKVRTETRHYLINSAGRTIFTFPKGMRPRSRVHGGALAVELSSGQLALLSVDGKVTELPRVMKRLGDFDRDYMVWSDASGRYGLAARNTVELIAPKYRSIHLVDSGRVLLESEGRAYCIADSAGTPKVRLNGFDQVKTIRSIAPGVVTPFQLIGKGFAGYILLDGHGHRIGSGPFPALNTDILPAGDGYVHTDFFNAQAAIHSILSLTTTSGWGGVEIGCRLSALLRDSLTADGIMTRSVSFLTDSMYMLKIKGVAYSDRVLGRDSVGEGGTHVYYPDTLSQVRYIRAECIVPARKFSELLQHAGAELVPSGFRAERLRDEYAVYAGEKLMIVLTPRPKLEGLFLYVMDKAFYNEAGERIMSDAERTFADSTNRQMP